jgi:hypothetical protein
MLKLHSKPSWWYITYKYGRQLLNTQYWYNRRKTPLSSACKLPSVCKDLDCTGQSFGKCQTQHYWHSSIPEEINISKLRHNTLIQSSSILKIPVIIHHCSSWNWGRSWDVDWMLFHKNNFNLPKYCDVHAVRSTVNSGNIYNSC